MFKKIFLGCFIFLILLNISFAVGYLEDFSGMSSNEFNVGLSACNRNTFNYTSTKGFYNYSYIQPYISGTCTCGYPLYFVDNELYINFGGLCTVGLGTTYQRDGYSLIKGDFTFYFQNSSTISFDCKETNGQTNDNRIEIDFGTSGVKSIYMSNATTGISNCTLFNITGSYCTDVMTNKVLTKDKIQKFCFNNTEIEGLKFNNFKLRTAHENIATIGRIWFDNLAFTNFVSNELPTFNFSLSSNSCYNKSVIGSSINVTLNISVSDAENDTIYYSLQAEQKDIFTIGEFQTTLKLKSCRILSLTDLILVLIGQTPLSCFDETGISIQFVQPNFINYDNNCGILSNNFSEFYISEYTNKNGNDVSMLLYNPNCNKRKITYLDVKRDLGYLRDFTYLTNIYTQNVVNNTFNLTFYNDLNLDLITLKLKFVFNETNNLSIYNVNESGEFFISEKFISTGLFPYISLAVSYDFDTNKFNLSVGNLSVLSNFTNNNGFSYSKITKYISISIAENYVYQEFFMYGGNILSPEWNLTSPSQVIIRRDGRIPVTLYITDSEHLNTNEFNYDTQYINIPECSDYYKQEDTTLITSFRRTNNNICNIFDNMLNIFGVDFISACLFVKIVATIISIVIASIITVAIMTFAPQLSAGVYLISFSFLQAVNSLFLSYTDNTKIFLGIFFALGIALLFLGLIFGGNFGGNTTQ